MATSQLSLQELSVLLGQPGPSHQDTTRSRGTHPEGSSLQGPDQRLPRAANRDGLEVASVGRGEPLRALPIPVQAQFTLQSVLEDFCERLSRSWSRELDLHAPVRCQNVIADSYAAFVLSRPQPTCFEVFSLGQMEGKLLLEFPYGTLFAFLEWLLGERQTSSPPPARSLTRLERRFMQWMHGNILESLTAAWDGIVPLQPHWERLETNARVVRCLPATEPILIATVGLELLGSDRDLRVALPLRSCFRACLGDYRAAAQL